jgi:hypothetical protein
MLDRPGGHLAAQQIVFMSTRLTEARSVQEATRPHVPTMPPLTGQPVTARRWRFARHSTRVEPPWKRLTVGGAPSSAWELGRAQPITGAVFQPRSPAALHGSTFEPPSHPGPHTCSPDEPTGGVPPGLGFPVRLPDVKDRHAAPSGYWDQNLLGGARRRRARPADTLNRVGPSRIGAVTLRTGRRRSSSPPALA